ncbi:hypothetical protein ANN_16834 [Periplaneta americana]|uniref:Uncharacterized protein n=1 Tax=Periplaneta americana TaxID=6978 RepID=A0ABQ8SSP5_PERAM|nr:hypothetical protein ANN_16834 [Periplaneta americana]
MAGLCEGGNEPPGSLKTILFLATYQYSMSGVSTTVEQQNQLVNHLDGPFCSTQQPFSTKMWKLSPCSPDSNPIENVPPEVKKEMESKWGYSIDT